MTNLTIKEGNRLINEYIERKVEFPDYAPTIVEAGGYYHQSFNWIMPVWVEIMNWGKHNYGSYWEQKITENHVVINHTKPNGVTFVSFPYKVLSPEDIWVVVVQFIEWYNKNVDNLREELLDNY